MVTDLGPWSADYLFFIKSLIVHLRYSVMALWVLLACSHSCPAGVMLWKFGCDFTCKCARALPPPFSLPSSQKPLLPKPHRFPAGVPALIGLESLTLRVCIYLYVCALALLRAMPSGYALVNLPVASISGDYCLGFDTYIYPIS